MEWVGGAKARETWGMEKQEEMKGETEGKTAYLSPFPRLIS
jgi:hypothetical protein